MRSLNWSGHCKWKNYIKNARRLNSTEIPHYVHFSSFFRIACRRRNQHFIFSFTEYNYTQNKSVFHVFSLKLRISFSVKIVATDVEGIVPTSVIAAVTREEGITSYMIFAYWTLEFLIFQKNRILISFRISSESSLLCWYSRWKENFRLNYLGLKLLSY